MKDLQLSTAGFVAIYIIIAVLLIAAAIGFLYHIRSPYGDKSVCRPIATWMTLYLIVAGLTIYKHVDTIKTKQFMSNVDEKAKEYTLYVNGIEVDTDNINIHAYNKDNILVDDNTKTIKIATGG